MGSYLTECFISHQTLGDNDVSWIFPIIKNSTYDEKYIRFKEKTFKKYGVTESTTRPNRFWDRFSHPFKGKYSDCHRFELLNEPENLRYVLLFLKKLTKYICEVDNFKFDYEISTLTESNYEEISEIWECLEEANREYEIFWYDPYKNNPIQITFAAAHNSACEIMISEYNRFMKNKTHTWHKANDKVTSIDLDSLEYVERETKYLDIDFSTAFIKILSGQHIYRKRLDFDETDKETVKSLIKQYVEKPTKANKNDILLYRNHAINSNIIMEMMDFYNVTIYPMIYVGHDYQNDWGDDYLKFMKKVNAKVNQDIQLRNAEYD